MSRHSATFSAAAEPYAASAHLQRRLAQSLIKALPAIPETILDLGCGTGYVLDALHERKMDFAYAGVDVAPGMISFCQQRHPAHSWMVHDATTVEIPAQSVQLLCSASALHWMDLGDGVWRRWLSFLAPDGVIALAGYGPSMFQELYTNCPGLSDRRPNYLSVDSLATSLSDLGLTIRHQQAQQWSESPDNLRTWLRHCHRLGLAGLGEEPLATAHVRTLLKTFDANPFDITYDTYTLIASLA